MVSSREIRQKFQEICVEGGRFIILIFAMSDMSEINSVKIIGKGDDLEASLSINADIGCVCLNVVELDKKESSSMALLNPNSKRIQESILTKAAQACSCE
jgi:hypothetical protein